MQEKFQWHSFSCPLSLQTNKKLLQIAAMMHADFLLLRSWWRRPVGPIEEDFFPATNRRGPESKQRPCIWRTWKAHVCGFCIFDSICLALYQIHVQWSCDAKNWQSSAKIQWQSAEQMILAAVIKRQTRYPVWPNWVTPSCLHLAKLIRPCDKTMTTKALPCTGACAWC